MPTNEGPKLVEVIYESNAMDPAAMAKKLAEDIESGKYGAIRSVSAVIEKDDGSVDVFGWGDVGLLRSIAILHLGIETLASMRLGK